MEKFKEMIVLGEAAFANNVGFSEMVKFYQTATPKQLDQMETIVKAEDWDGFKAIIQKVLGVKLK